VLGTLNRSKTPDEADLKHLMKQTKTLDEEDRGRSKTLDEADLKHLMKQI
jgi:hypothetical protein